MPDRLLPWLLLVCCLLGAGLGCAQTTEVLKEKRQRLQRQLQQTNTELKTTRRQRGAAVGQASLLRQRIEQRTELLTTLRQEVARSAVRLHRDSTVVAALSDDLAAMRQEYGAALRAAHRARLTRGWLAFLLSAEGFNAAFRRLVYLRQYRNYRRRQARHIRQTRTSLSTRFARLTQQRAEQDSLLQEALAQDETLRGELATQTALVSRLSTNEKDLLARIGRQQQQTERLSREIRAAISRAIAGDERRKRRSATPTGAAASEVTELGRSLQRSRGKLGWPVRGRVVRPFGTQPHPEVPTVKIKNSGVDIDGGPNAPVEAVFAGEVISRREVPGLRTLLMLRHGGYYTVYSNVAFPQVRLGDRVAAGQQLGLTGATDYALHFELWKGKTPLNPARWLIP